jgi:hypothetical protein
VLAALPARPREAAPPRPGETEIEPVSASALRNDDPETAARTQGDIRGVP